MGTCEIVFVVELRFSLFCFFFLFLLLIFNAMRSKAKHFLGVDDHEEYEEKDSEFEYYFEHEPDTRQPDVELLLTASGLKPLMAHHWEKHSFRRPQNCAQCNKFIW